MMFKRRSLITLALTLAIASALVACGSSDPAPSDGSPVPDTRRDDLSPHRDEGLHSDLRSDLRFDLPPCQPRTCKDYDLECGTVDDGCGTRLQCGTCAPGLEQCVSGHCKDLKCGDDPRNVCGGCSVLKAAPGDSCKCQGLVVECSPWGGLRCKDGANSDQPLKMPDTDDGKDDWTVVKASLARVPGDTGWDYDEYVVKVEDTAFGVMSPTFQVEHAFTAPVKICIDFHIADPLVKNGDVFLRCSGGGQSDTKISSCCLTIPAGKGIFDMGAAINFGVPSFFDESGTFTISIRPKGSSSAGTTLPDCALYTLRYHF